MQRYGGRLIHVARDEQGLVEVVETGAVRALHFGTPHRQSALGLDAPEQLELSYLRAMLAIFLYASDPRRVLVLGLGAGSLAGFLWRQLPAVTVDAVEARPLVAAVARELFGLPDDARLRVWIGDAGAFLAAQPAARYDHIHVDLFDQDGMAPLLAGEDFFAAIARLVTPCGGVAMNLWRNRPVALRETLDRLRRHFPGGAWRLDVAGRGNIIGLATGPAAPSLGRRELERRARILERGLGIEFTRLLGRITPLD